MRRGPIVAAAVLITSMAVSAAAAPKPGKPHPRRPIGNNPHPVIRGGAKAKPAPAKPQASKQRPPAKHHPKRHGHGGHRSRSHGGHAPFFGYGYGFVPYYVEPYYFDFGFYWPYYAYPPYYVPQPPAPPAEPPRAADQPEPRIEPLRSTNARAVALAWKFIGFGDAQFARGEFAEANDRYRKAARSGPQVADAWFRQGFALAAMGRYDLAVGAIRRGLELDPKWSASGFEPDELFGGDAAAKQAHLDALVSAAEDDPLNAELLFIVGVHLHFDGQAARAEQYFRRAQRIAGDGAEHVLAFLSK